MWLCTEGGRAAAADQGDPELHQSANAPARPKVQEDQEDLLPRQFGEVIDFASAMGSQLSCYRLHEEELPISR